MTDREDKTPRENETPKAEPATPLLQPQGAAFALRVAEIPLWHLLLTALLALLSIKLVGLVYPGLGAGAGLSAGVEAGVSAEEQARADGQTPALPVARISFLLIVQNLILLVAVLALLRVHRLKLADLGLRKLSTRQVLNEIFLGLLLVPAMAILNLVLLSLYLQFLREMPEVSQLPILLSGETSRFGNGLFVATVSLFVPFSEELLFRGLVFVWLFALAGPLPAALVSAGIFAAVHLPLGLIPLMFFFGMVAAWRFVVIGSLWAPILLHAAFNCANVLLFFAARDLMAEVNSQNAVWLWLVSSLAGLFF